MQGKVLRCEILYSQPFFVQASVVIDCAADPCVATDVGNGDDQGTCCDQWRSMPEPRFEEVSSAEYNSSY